jgi:hypothetical protein
MALLGLLTGETSSSGCSGNFNIPSNTGDTERTRSLLAVNPVWDRLAHYWWLIAIAAAVLFILFIVFLYISSVARFILFEAVVVGRVSLRAAWRRWRSTSHTYFLFQLALFVFIWGALLIIVGLPVLFAYRAGFFQNLGAHLAASALVISALTAVTLLVLVAGSLAHVLTKDFVVPIMALESLPFGSAWRRFASIVSHEKGGFAAYIGMKVVLGVGAAILFGLGGLLLILFLLIPIFVVAAIAIAVGAAAGLTWTPMTIALAVALGINSFIGIMIFITFLHTPLAAFFPSYALYFLAGRYAPLQDRLYPPPPTVPPPSPVDPLNSGGTLSPP